jgi:hypothetical protein
MSEISGAVEGPTDESVLRRLVQEAGGTVGRVYGRQGKDHLLRQISAYNHAARFYPWIVLMDLDRETQCLSQYIPQVLPEPMADKLCLRFAVRAVEAWLLADRERFSTFFSVNETRIPLNPDALLNPKKALIDLAQRSRRRDVRESLVPRAESGRAVGPGYTYWLIEYIQDPRRGWRPEVAASASESLARCRACIRRLMRDP